MLEHPNSQQQATPLLAGKGSLRFQRVANAKEKRWNVVEMSLKKANLYLVFRKVSAESRACLQNQPVISTARNPHPVLFSCGPLGQRHHEVD